MKRDQILQRLKTDKPFDMIVIGGGATGCGIALDAASRGLDVALVEKNDLAEGTSGRSTKLLHGGVRYLEMAVKHLDRGQYHLVRDALKERAILLRLAPHLSHRLPLVTPLYKWIQIPYIFSGLKLYDILAGSKGIGTSRLLGRKKALEQLDTKFTSDDGEVGEDYSDDIKDKELERMGRLEELKAKQDETESRFDEQIASELEPVIKQGQRLEKTLQDSVDTSAKDDLIFPNTDTVIVKKGEKISTAHIANIQDVVKQRLSEIEESLQEEKDNELEHIKLDVARVRAETTQEIKGLRDDLDQAIDSAQSEYKRLREELIDLQPLTFMGEAEYRELRSRWGQVFQA